MSKDLKGYCPYCGTNLDAVESHVTRVLEPVIDGKEKRECDVVPRGYCESVTGTVEPK